MEGNTKERQYSSNYVDLSKKSYENVGVVTNWYQGTRISEERSKSIMDFKPLGQLFTPGYLSLAYYCATIDDSVLNTEVLTTILLGCPLVLLRKYFHNGAGS